MNHAITIRALAALAALAIALPKTTAATELIVSGKPDGGIAGKGLEREEEPDRRAE